MRHADQERLQRSPRRPVRVAVAGVVGVGVEVDVLLAVVVVRVRVERPAAPAHEQADCEEDDDHADRALGGALDDLRQEHPGKDDGEAEGDQRHRMADPPARAEAACRRRPAVALPRHERRDGDEVVGVEGVPQSEQESDQQDDLDVWTIH